MGIALSAAGLTKTFREGERIVEVLKGVDLEVETGALLGIVAETHQGVEVDGAALPPGRHVR